ncbi:MAG: response regulator [Novosphingobium sp.]|uniref:response regulator n=1 Tax=Novosphingobium sp. TaxID=1874826 RepID=UPI003C7C1AD1
MTAVTPILVVEDEAMIRMGLVAVLTDGGFSIEECGSGAAAITLIDQIPDLQGLITDIRLGNGPSGWDVARHARKRFPYLAVLYVTGDSAAEWTSQGVPGSLILQKPYADAQLMTAIANLLIEALPLRSTESGPSE